MVNIDYTPHTVRNGKSRSGSITPSSLSSRHETVAEETDQSRIRGMVLPFEPHSITFDELTYSVDMPQVSRNRINIEYQSIFYEITISNTCTELAGNEKWRLS
jgi:hypothetical protein